MKELEDAGRFTKESEHYIGIGKETFKNALLNPAKLRDRIAAQLLEELDEAPDLILFNQCLNEFLSDDILKLNKAGRTAEEVVEKVDLSEVKKLNQKEGLSEKQVESFGERYEKKITNNFKNNTGIIIRFQLKRKFCTY